MRISDALILAGFGYIGWKLLSVADTAQTAVRGQSVFWPLVDDAARGAGIPTWALAAIVNTESSWNNGPSMSICKNGKRASESCDVPCAASCFPTCAIGLAQLKAKYFAPGGDARALCDPATNLRIAADLLAHLYGRFRDWNVAFVAYNQGEGAAQAEITAGRNPITLNADYVQKASRAAAGFGAGSALAGLSRVSLFAPV